MQCELGKSCFIQNYFDHQDGEDYKDYRCGHLTYNQHTGTDFRVIDEVAMRRGVPVLAAAPGRVIGSRDGEPDIAITIRGEEKIAGKGAGNGVVIDHGDGWHTQYSHLQNGSVRAKSGDWVERGQPIGLIGESGKADFPHVDFSVRKNGQAIDPFWPVDVWSCNTEESPHSLWSMRAVKSLGYIDTAILQIGFSDHIPTRLEAQTGRTPGSAGILPNDARQLVLWASVMGSNKDDQWHIDVTFPNGQTLIGAQGRINGNKAVAIIGSGKRLLSQQWPRGRYKGRFTIERNGKRIQSEESTIVIE